ncbi:serine hydrolase domain-containing protein [Congregibacter litoralis]|uniref:Beta-lactamase class C and other penicillin binding protein n=1 Tax=Congregibacter litoralis KT71 TaxID=314285 RepID=A4A6Z1_9GAMM|nr:serine hydrolase domain-containing protein [Congregibacter litoralis]EAQ98060.1 Beta-lactamase class C and other penicillin binding protein [Congregibacter litoralis KT71]
MKYVKLALAVIASLLLWAGLVFAALDQGWGHSPLARNDDIAEFAIAAQEIAQKNNAGNLSFTLLEHGMKVAEFHLSKDRIVDGQSVFQVASLGKWLTAWGIMTLVEEGEIDLDAPVSKYLSRWQIPASQFDASGVTVRRLLSHTAGLTDNLGYDGFDTAGDRQTLEASLTKAADASPGKDGQTLLGREPGSAWQYSGASYTLLQLLIEEVSGKDFPEFMHHRVFAPMDMNRSTFDHSEAIELGLVQNFTPDGKTEPFRWYTALAATSLFTTSEDLARFIARQGPGSTNPVLTREAIALTRTPHASDMGAEIWGLGAMLYAPNNSGDFIIGHDGSNEPAINTSARLDPATGDGIVILSTGTPMLATQLAGEWVFWKTGNVDSLSFASRLPTALAVFAGGTLVILIGVPLAIWLRTRSSKRPRRGD